MKILLIVFLAVSGIMAVREKRAKGGVPIPIDVVPYLISIRRDNKHICSGALITPTHVLTAAHCVLNDRDPISRLKVVSNANHEDASGTTHDIELIIRPDGYRPLIDYRNVAVLKLSKPARRRFNNVRTIELSPWGPKDFTVAEYFAYNSQVDKHGKHNLQQIELLIVPAEECVPYIFGEDITSLDKSCGKLESLEELEKKDLGGPIVQFGKVVGILSNIDRKRNLSRFPQFQNVHLFWDVIENAKKSNGSSFNELESTVFPYSAKYFRD